MEFPEKEYLKQVCFLGAGSKCCRYLVYDTDGWRCAKRDLKLKKMIDDRFEKQKFNAQGDNCKVLN